jgi:hypothetical protein
MSIQSETRYLFNIPTTTYYVLYTFLFVHIQSIGSSGGRKRGNIESLIRLNGGKHEKGKVVGNPALKIST